MKLITRLMIRRSVLGTVAAALVASSAWAVAPHPNVINKSASSSEPSYYLTHRDELHARGVCQPDHFFKAAGTKGAAGTATAAGPFRVLALLVKFSDKNSSVVDTFYDSLVFGSVGNTVHTYFSEISYSQLDLVTVNLPSALGWSTAPQTYAYYVNGQQGFGTYPQNAQKMVEDLVDLVDPSVNFANYDNDNDGYVDVLLVIHAGSGAEFTGSNNDIWSHKWGISPRLKDGKYVSSYTTQPEYWSNPGDMTIGVYSHELCHGFGLPDLYDTDNSSWGVGRWCIMAYGSWNGLGGMGGSPSHPCAWSRIQMGLATATNVTGNLSSQTITPVNSGGQIFRLWNSGAVSNEYFLAENRQKTGFDSYLPQSGLLIWHIDDAKGTNTDEWYPGQPGSNHYLVALEQADGLFELEHKTDVGDAGDPFPGATSKSSFNVATNPGSSTYLGAATFVAVQNISPSGSNITADLIVGLAAGVDDDVATLPTTPVLEQNYPNPFNPATKIEFSLAADARIELTVINLLGQAVKTLASGQYAAGTHEITWDATDESGAEVGTGVYLYRLVAGDEVQSKKMVLLR